MAKDDEMIRQLRAHALGAEKEEAATKQRLLNNATWLDLGITEFRISRRGVEVWFDRHGYIMFCPFMVCMEYMSFEGMNWSGSNGCYCDEPAYDETDVIS